MRIISQDGLYDIAYEALAIRFHEDDRAIIIGVPLSINIPNIKLGEYSTEAKAEKAMEMLREQYSRLQVVKILASGTCEHMEKSLSKDEFLECNLKYREMNIFQFPKDEDAEV